MLGKILRDKKDEIRYYIIWSKRKLGVIKLVGPNLGREGYEMKLSGLIGTDYKN